MQKQYVVPMRWGTKRQESEGADEVLVTQGEHSPERGEQGHQRIWEAFATEGELPIPYEHLLGVTRATFQAVEELKNSG